MKLLENKFTGYLAIYLLLITFLAGCTEISEDAGKNSLTTKDASITVTVDTPISILPQKVSEVPSSIESMTPLIKTSTLEDISTYIDLTRKEVFKKLGNGYKIISAGGEGTEEGYYYEDIGLSFIFNTEGNSSKIAWIDCSDDVDINGAKNGMSFEQVMDRLGKTKIEDTFIETPDHKAYVIKYIIGKCKIDYSSQNKDGKEGGFSVYLNENFANGENDQAYQIKSTIRNNSEYKINLYSGKPLNGQVKYDFNMDGDIEILEYSTVIGKNQSGYEVPIKCTLKIGEFIITREYNDKYEAAGGISCLSVVDIDKNDNYVDFFISEGELADRVNNVFYRLTNDGIEQLFSVNSAILGYSGIGRIYFWEGLLFDQKINNTLNTDLVLIYFDYNKKQYTQTDQIIGKKIVADQQIFLYKTNKDVVHGAPLTDDEIIEQKGDRIIKIIKPGEEFVVTSIDHDAAFDLLDTSNEGEKLICFNDNGIKIRTNDEMEGWIGGFHMVWD